MPGKRLTLRVFTPAGRPLALLRDLHPEDFPLELAGRVVVVSNGQVWLNEPVNQVSISGLKRFTPTREMWRC